MIPKVSVIIPIYNDELYLTDSLQSVYNQTFSDFECICVNDGSDDSTENIIDRFIGKDTRFSKINKLNGGVSAARNTGLEAAKGEFIFFMDHDDLIAPDALQNLFNTALEFNTNMVRGRMMMIPETFTIGELPKPTKRLNTHLFENPITDFYRNTRGRNKTWCYIWQCLFRHTAIRQIRFVESLRAGREDNLFMYEVIAGIKSYVQIDAVIAYHRHSKTSAMLSGYKPAQINMFDVAIPFVYNKYAIVPTIDRRLVWWVYHKESYGVYRFLVRNSIRSGSENLIQLAREIFIKYSGTPAWNEIWKRWSLRQKFFFWLFMSERYRILKLLQIFL